MDILRTLYETSLNFLTTAATHDYRDYNSEI